MRSIVTLGVIVAPRLERDVPPELAEQLAEDLARRHPSVDWRTELVVDRLVEPPARVTDILEDARRRLLESRWHLALVVTDLPPPGHGKPVSRRASRTHGVALVSLPALGRCTCDRDCGGRSSSSSTSCSASRTGRRTMSCAS